MSLMQLGVCLTIVVKYRAYFGTAAFNVNGTTLHSLLQLPIRAKRNAPFTATALSKLQDDLNGIKCLIIDKYSVIGQKCLVGLIGD